MRYEMKLKKREMSGEDAGKVLESGIFGVLSTISPDHEPYGVPVNYVYFNGCIYFHCAKSGRKLENIIYNSSVSFNVTTQAHVIPEGFTTSFTNAMAFGRASIVDDEAEKRQALTKLGEKYSAPYMDRYTECIDRSIRGVCIVKITISAISGKQSG